jgi:SAM-dependent methyltransferase
MEEVKLGCSLKANYEDYYADADAEWRRLGAIGKADNIVTLCRDLPCDSVLEIGAGEGSLLHRLSDLGFGKSLFALEISTSGVAAIKRRAIDRLVECATFDGYRVPYEPDRFDVVVLSHVVEHLEHPRQLLYEAARVAKLVFVEVPLEDTIRLSDDFTFDHVGHINFYSVKTIRRLVQSCGLRIRRQLITNPPKATHTYNNRTRGLINYYIKQLSLRVSPRVAARMFCYHHSMVCEKADAV